MAIPLKAAFDPLSATDYDDLVRLAQPLRAYKTADQAFSSTTEADDNHLAVTPDINSMYDVSVWLKVGVATTVDFKVKFSGHASAGGWWTIKNQTQAGASETVFQNDFAWSAGAIVEGHASDKIYEIFGVLVTGSTAAVLRVQCGVGAAGTATVRTYSRMRLDKH